MAKASMWLVKELAQQAGVSVRTLHHYDEIGLLVPSRRSAAGYRVYSEQDALRLQHILISRELGLPLEQIKRALDDPGFDRRAALTAQRAELSARAERTSAMLRAIDAALHALQAPNEGGTMSETTNDQLRALFDGFDPSQHEPEAQARWGASSAFQESARRTRGYTADDWARYKREAHAIMEDAASLLRAGATGESDDARAVAERHRQLIDRWFYPCDPAMHTRLAELYEADARFAVNIDVHAQGLTPWLVAAIRANAR